MTTPMTVEQRVRRCNEPDMLSLTQAVKVLGMPLHVVTRWHEQLRVIGVPSVRGLVLPQWQFLHGSGLSLLIEDMAEHFWENLPMAAVRYQPEDALGWYLLEFFERPCPTLGGHTPLFEFQHRATSVNVYDPIFTQFVTHFSDDLRTNRLASYVEGWPG